MIVSLLLTACNGPGGAEDVEVVMADYAGLSADRSWTFRDDGGQDSPDEATLLRGRADGEGGIELRRGITWADGSEAGSLLFDEGAGLALTSWELWGEAGEGRYPFATPTPTEGAHQAGDGGWDCVAGLGEPVETWYGTFEEAITFDCTGDEGPTGSWAFGREVGLIRFVPTEGAVLDLVAPF